MEENKPIENKAVSKQAIRERQQTARRVYLDPSSPSVRSIVRVAIIVMLLIYVVFDQLLTIPWPPTLLGTYFPQFKVIPSV